MNDRVTDELIKAWEINYGLSKRTPEEACRWWSDNNHGMAPAGAVAALGLCIAEIKALREAERKKVVDFAHCYDIHRNDECPYCGECHDKRAACTHYVD